MNRREVLEVLRFLLVGGVLGVLSVMLPREVPIALSIVAAMSLPVIVWLVLFAPRSEVRVLIPIFLGAVAVRVIVALTIEVAASADYFSLDQGRYQLLGRELAAHWAGHGASPELHTSEAGYYVWNAIVYTLVGYVPLAVAFSNATVAGVSVLFTYQIAREMSDEVAARYAALFAAFFPSIVLWSSLNLKDACTILCILAALRGAQILQSRLTPVGVMLLVAGIAGLSQFRNYLVAMVLVSAGLAILLPRLRAGAVRVAVAAVIAVMLLMGSVPDPIEEFAQEANFAALDKHRRNLAIGDSAYHGDADVSTPGAALKFLPLGLAYFLFAPAPWQLWNARQWLTLPEMLLWYALLPQVYFGARQVLRRRAVAGLGPACFALLATLSYALVESNLGTAYRHRAQVLIFYLIFAAIGIASRRRERVSKVDPSFAPSLAPEVAT